MSTCSLLRVWATIAKRVRSLCATMGFCATLAETRHFYYMHTRESLRNYGGVCPTVLRNYGMFNAILAETRLFFDHPSLVKACATMEWLRKRVAQLWGFCATLPEYRLLFNFQPPESLRDHGKTCSTKLRNIGSACATMVFLKIKTGR